MSKIKFIYEEDIQFIQKNILTWFEKNGRYFPWRKKSATNYELIISEIFLQRTKAETVAKFLPCFLKKYPSWKKLGEATELELQEMIRPIGINKIRGRRLFKLAQELKKRNGRFPRERNQVEELPMMGQYITNAFELFILKKKSPLLDINMTRLIERYFGQRRLVDIRYDPYLQTISYRITNIEKSKELNWAILDYGALICKAKNPKCLICAIRRRCKYYNTL